MYSHLKRWSKILCLAVLFTFVISFVPIEDAFAATDSVKDESFSGSEFQSKMDKAMDEANIFERFIMNLINSVFKMTGLAPITELIYGNPYQYWISDGVGDLNYGLFFDKEITLIIEPVMTTFTGLYGTFIIIAILISTLRMGVFRPHSPQAVSDFWKDLQMWVVSAIFMFAIWDIVNILCGFNLGIVNMFEGLLNSNGISTSGMSIVATADDSLTLFGLGDIIILLGEWILGAILNFIYLARKITILILLLLSPLVAYSLLYARTRQFFSVWLKELCGNIFLQSMHAMIMYGFAIIASMGASVLVKLFLLCLFIPLSGLLSKLLSLGDSSTRLGQGLSVAGLSSVAGLMALTGSGRKAFGKGGNATGAANSGSRAGGSGGGSSIDGPSSSDYSVGGLTHRRENGMNRALNLARTAGKITGATVGTLAGMVAGPGGAVAGGMIGAKLGGAPVTMAENFGKGTANTFKSIKDYNAFRKSDNASENLTAQRFHKGQIGASIGQMVGGEKGAMLGKKMGVAFSGVTRRSAAIHQFGGRSLQDISKSNPGAQFYQKIDSQKSGFYMRGNNGEEQLVSVLGSGMPGLENPVYVDYATPSSNSTVKSNGNGTYSMSVPTVNQTTGAIDTSVDRQAGLSGSSQYLLRKSDAYTVDANGNRHAFNDYDASKTNPDSYFNHGAEGMQTGTFGGRVLDNMRNTPSASEQQKRDNYNQKLATMAREAEAQSGERKKAIP